jgi:hypothetical protein
VPRRNKFPDAILLADDLIFLIEFKAGATEFDSAASWQVKITRSTCVISISKAMAEPSSRSCSPPPRCRNSRFVTTPLQPCAM